jgi:hypothetical protein
MLSRIERACALASLRSQAVAGCSGAWSWLARQARTLAAVSTIILGLGMAQAAPETHIVGPDGQPARLQDVLLRAADGDTIELLPGDYGPLHLVLEDRRLTLRGLGENRPVIDGGGRMGEARALITVRGGDVVLENLELRGARATNAQGAGVLQQGGRLTLRGVRLRDNEQGVMALNDPEAVVIVEDSEFGMAPRVEGGLHHLLNVGRIARLQVSGSRFQQGFEGHLIKSRAAVTDIRHNLIHDGPRGGVSYEIELPLGGEATIIGNVIGQGSQTQNPVMVAYGSEGSVWPRNRLVMAHNTLLNYMRLPAWFLRTWPDRLPPDTEVVAVNNLLVGGGVFSLSNRGHFEGNRHVMFRSLRDADTYAFELAPDARARGQGVDPRGVRGLDLSPGGEFKWPVGVEPLPLLQRWSPGAFQR